MVIPNEADGKPQPPPKRSLDGPPSRVGNQAMLIKELWRYPVKSMAGEKLDTAEITEHGIAGDRILQVRDAAGRIFSARTRPGLLRHAAVLRPNGDVLVDGRPWNDKKVAADIEKAAGAGTRLIRSD